jgi:penicillin-insensitive murein DD-endopeptidase
MIGVCAVWYVLHVAGCAPATDARAAPAPQTAAPVATASAQPQAAEAPSTGSIAAISAKNEPNLTPLAELAKLPGSVSTSIGGPSSGQVRAAVALPDEGPGFVHNKQRPYEARFGTIELVQTIMRAAALVDAALPGSVLVVNDLGLQEGGPIPHHGSHQAGRDADILFYSVDATGKPLPSVGVPIDPKGQGVDFKDLTDPSDDQPVALDVARTWRYAAALIEAAGDHLQRIFIVEHVRSMLLAEAARAQAYPAVVKRFEDLTCQPEYPHDDHMHIRLYCTAEDMALGCRDSLPSYPFRVAALSALGLSPLIASAQRTPSAERAHAALKTTNEQAIKKAGPMHAAVLKFLDQRKAWLKRPSPGRRYCP